MLENEIEDAQRLVRTDAYQLSIGELINMYRDGELIINPDFQRLFRWEIGQKSKLIESILLGIPLPSIFVFEKDDGKWELIDGLQRVSTILEFTGFLKNPTTRQLEPPTALVATRYLPSLNDTVWERSENPAVQQDNQSELAAPLKLAIRRSRLAVEILKRPSSNDTKYDLFQRLNAGGTQANAQELRNVIVIMVNPEYHTFMRGLAQRPSYLSVLSASADQLEKQRAMEYVSRYLVHTYVQYDGKLDVEEFIDQSIVILASAGINPASLETFNATFDLLNEAFGQNALRRFDDDGNPSGRVLLAAYECIAIGIAKNIANVRAKPDPLNYIQQRIRQFWRDPAIDNFFVAGLRGTVRIQRTVPFGTRWFSV